MTSLFDKLDKESNQSLLRVLAYGMPKAKKTWWALAAAEAGYNVLDLDGDDGWQIGKYLSEAAQKRIEVIEARDRLGQPVFAPFVVQALKRLKFGWNPASNKFDNLGREDGTLQIDLREFTQNDVLILDSWTAFVQSLYVQYAKEQDIDLTDATKTDWDGYNWCGALALWTADVLVSLPCHVIVIAHGTVYEKRSKDGKSVISQKRQIKSTSGPNAMQLPAKFSDILYFYPKGSAFKIDVKVEEEADGGSRSVPPGTYNWDDLSFERLIEYSNIPKPPADHPKFDFSKTVSTAKPKLGTKPAVINPAAKPSVSLRR